MADAFDLDVFAPRAISFTLRGKGYAVSGDPDVDVVALMLRIEEQIKDSETVDETVSAVQEGKQLLIEMISEHDPSQDVSAFKVGSQDVLLLFALIMHGSSVAAAVAEAITQAAPGGSEAGDAVTTSDDADGERAREGDEAPLASAELLSARSSTSGESDDGLPATGTG